MSVRRRTWTTAKGEEKSAWVVDYIDTKGHRRLKSFARKKEADAFAARASVEVREGTHVADRETVTVAKAGDLWIATGEASELERSSIEQRKRHLKLHIVPMMGDTLLSKLTVPLVRDFEDRLRAAGRTPVMIRKVVGSLGSLCADAQERGLTTRNPVREVRARRKGADRRQESRAGARLVVGEDIPTREEVKALVSVLDGRWRPLLLVAIFAGLRSSELRGLRWQDIDLEGRAIIVRQRADQYGAIGRPKSKAGSRTVPIPPLVVNTLREWKLGYSRPIIGRDAEGEQIREDARPAHLVFANGSGNVESHANIVNRGLVPALLRAGVTVETGEVDVEGRPMLDAKYKGLHPLRHFFASWLINRPQDGGLGLPLKVVQERMGHASVMMTADVYGHLFPRGDDADELAAAERSLLG